MANNLPDAFNPRAADQQAADWLARRDRGLNAAEQDAYLQWLREDSRHAGLIARHEQTARRLKQLAQWQPAGSSEPNPDLFARPRGRWSARLTALGAVAAALVIGILGWQSLAPQPTPPPAATGSFLRVNERQALADGSAVELRDGSRIAVMFSATERRVRLVGGEANFIVAKDPARPFIVEAGGVAVRAVGTVFAVRLDAATVDVLVTEGKVRVETPPAAERSASHEEVASEVPASHRAVVSLAPAAPAPQVLPVTPEQIREALDWQAARFQFYETPLADAVREFNRHNHQQLVLGDESLGAMRIGGTFRADNVEGFVSLLHITLGLRSESRGPEETILLAPR
jgi:transmembrane sensor